MARILSACLFGTALPLAAPSLAQDIGGGQAQLPAYSLPAPQAPAYAQRFRPAGPVYGDDNPNRRPFNAGSDTKGDTNQPSHGPLSTIGKRLADEGIRFRALETNEY